MNEEKFYDKLKLSLEESTKFPSNYLFKFILPSIPDRITQVENIFNHLGAVIEKKASKNGNYTSISIEVQMQNADQIIEKYKEAAIVKGIISL